MDKLLQLRNNREAAEQLVKEFREAEQLELLRLEQSKRKVLKTIASRDLLGPGNLNEKTKEGHCNGIMLARRYVSWNPIRKKAVMTHEQVHAFLARAKTLTAQVEAALFLAKHVDVVHRPFNESKPTPQDSLYELDLTDADYWNPQDLLKINLDDINDMYEASVAHI